MRLVNFLFGLFCSVVAMTAGAQTYPNKPIRLIVPYPPGGATDVLARQLSVKLGPALGQTVVVENRSGASGNIGFDYVAKAPADGYTLLMGTANITIGPAFSKLPFNVLTDFAPVTTIVSSQNLLVVRPSLPARNLKELLAFAKANPEKLTYGTSGIGTPLMTIELMKAMADVKLMNVPYKGDAPAINDLLGGQIDMYASTVTGLIEHVKAGKLRAIGVTGTKRAASLPDVPTMAEAGIPGYELVSWYGILAPAGTPREIVQKLNETIVKVVATPEMQQQIVAGGSDPWTQTPEEFTALIRRDVAKFSKLVKDFNIRAE
ncbi:tripartite tricarboxylate transporter substrate binding protein [Ramlibacter henchirensis]|uniref:Tripartite tricarboxylate transporter substrate binding protein n=1 Tax=Ramlibacter henchirensis TaxID=204072 RepID=A0A4Z0BU07_9BURK|nr:tripartite tricarboxylate transporter substrate binding protein [Ramlibacter henchirensis]TFZ02807.1 tripartite tricarboxylate transporter substrate binding protein [Ramlibacter henchirensis]